MVEEFTIGDNIIANINGDILTLKIDITKIQGPSKSGKTMIIASSRGNKTINGTSIKAGINIYK